MNMFVYNINKYNGITYKYDLDDYDIMNDPAFDETLHDNSIDVNSFSSLGHMYNCAYCKQAFESRNKLFYHLGYMNIDIRPKGSDHEVMVVETKRKRNQLWSIIKPRSSNRVSNRRSKKRALNNIIDLLSTTKI